MCLIIEGAPLHAAMRLKLLARGFVLQYIKRLGLYLYSYKICAKDMDIVLLSFFYKG